MILFQKINKIMSSFGSLNTTNKTRKMVRVFDGIAILSYTAVLFQQIQKTLAESESIIINEKKNNF